VEAIPDASPRAGASAPAQPAAAGILPGGGAGCSRGWRMRKGLWAVDRIAGALYVQVVAED
jgi:hypothetical protein